jgi:hypothetical protein
MTDLQKAAQAVIDRWNSPKWEWMKQGPTALLISDLHAALEQEKNEDINQVTAAQWAAPPNQYAESGTYARAIKAAVKGKNKW